MNLHVPTWLGPYVPASTTPCIPQPFSSDAPVAGLRGTGLTNRIRRATRVTLSPHAPAAVQSSTQARHERNDLGFRPDIQGLRAVAVGLVMLSHIGLTFAKGVLSVSTSSSWSPGSSSPLCC